MQTKAKMFKLFLIIILISSSSCKAQLEGKYKNISNSHSGTNTYTEAELINELRNAAKAAQHGVFKHNSSSEKTNNSRVEIIKEFKNGKFVQHIVDKRNQKKTLLHSGKYAIVNDSIFAEFMDYHLYGQLDGKMYLMKYEIHQDTLIQSGEVYQKIKGSQNAYYRTPIYEIYLKID